MSKKRKLTRKQEMFIREYVVSLNATQAAIKSGYSKKSAEIIGYENLRKPYITAEIEKIVSERNKSLKVDSEWVLKQAIKLHKRCMQEEPVLDEEGNPVGEFKFEHSGAAKALEMIGKHVDVMAWDKTKNITGDITLHRHKYLDGRKSGA